MTPVSPHKLEAMATACASSVSDVLWSCLAHHRPADRALNYHLRANRHLGARDRRLISETLFALLRWWGWVHRLVPPAFTTAAFADSTPGQSAPATRPEQWGAAFLAAHLLESEHLPVAAWVWRQQAGVHSKALQAIATSREPEFWSRRMDPFYRPGEKPVFRQRDLLPSWALREIDPECSQRQLLLWLQKRPPVWLRAQRCTVQELRAALIREAIILHPKGPLPDAVAIEPPRVNLRTTKPFRDGWFEVQDAASQCIGLICAPKPGQRWWDACAGAGGKTLHLGTLMKSKGTVVASDIRTAKLDDLRRRARRANLSNIRTREWKGKALPAKTAAFHGVLVDVPCTCSGTWRRNPDARWTTRRSDIATFAETQLQLLSNAATAVAPGGVLVYATCSLFLRENSGVVRDFLQSHPEFTLDPFPHPLTGERTDGTVQIWPWEADCDAMFAARMLRRTAAS